MKQTYYRRKKVWRLQCYLMNFGNRRIEDVNQRITSVYRTGIPTRVIAAITKDENNKDNPLIEDFGMQKFRINPHFHASAIQ